MPHFVLNSFVLNLKLKNIGIKKMKILVRKIQDKCYIIIGIFILGLLSFKIIFNPIICKISIQESLILLKVDIILDISKIFIYQLFKNLRVQVSKMEFSMKLKIAIFFFLCYNYPFKCGLTFLLFATIFWKMSPQFFYGLYFLRKLQNGLAKMLQ